MKRSYFFTILATLVTLTVSAEAENLRDRVQSRLDDNEPIDANKDGTVTLEETAHKYKGNKEERLKLFHTFDANKDGRIAAAEYPDQAKFKQADYNKDGFLTENEFLASFAQQTAKKVDKIDRNDDAVLSPEEIQDATQSRREQRQERRKNR